MEYLIVAGIIFLVLFGLLVFMPLAMVRHTEWESDQNHPVYITKQYINKIGWQTAHRQQLSILVSWCSLIVFLDEWPSPNIERLFAFGAVSLVSVSWFVYSFKGFFQCSTHWYDNSAVMAVLLVIIAVLNLLAITGLFFSLLLGGTVSIWWGGRLMMYKAIRDKNA